MAYFERFVSRRYLVSHENRRLVTFITFISVAGVTVGVAALIIVIGVIDGIDRDIFGKFVEVHPHVKITGADGGEIEDPETLLARVAGRDEVERAGTVIQKQVLFERTASAAGAKIPGVIIGVDELGEGQLYSIPNASNGSNIRLYPREVLMGAPLLYQLGAEPGDRIIATTGKLHRTPAGWMSRRRNLRVIGHYTTGLWDFDTVTAFVSTETAREVFGMEDRVDYIHLRLKKPFEAAALKKILASELGDAYEIHTWEEQNREFFQALKLEKLGLFVILMLVVIVAGFNIIGTLILMVMEKTREIGILKAFGAGNAMIRNIFLGSGFVIGLIGTVSGLILGLMGCYLVKNVIHLDIADSPYNLRSLPVVVKPLTVSLIVACSMAVSVVAAVFPAMQAARLNTIEALRHE